MSTSWQQGPPEPVKSSPLGWLALGVAVLGVAMLAMPVAPIFSLVPALVGLVLGIAVLVRRRRPEAPAIAAIVVSVLPAVLIFLGGMALAIAMSGQG